MKDFCNCLNKFWIVMSNAWELNTEILISIFWHVQLQGVLISCFNSLAVSISRSYSLMNFPSIIHWSMGSAMSPHFLTKWVSRLLGWLWYSELTPVLVFIAFSFSFPSPSISRCFSIHSSSPVLWCPSCLFFTADVHVFAPIRSTLYLLTFKVSFQAWVSRTSDLGI